MSFTEPKTEISRRRIVVPLDRRERAGAAREAAPRKSRARKILAIVAISLVGLLLCVAVGLFFWWQHYKTTPAYSLALLVDAAQRNDMPAVDKIVDTDKIVDNFTAHVAEQVAGSYGPALNDAVRKQVDSLLPGLMPAIKQVVRDGIAARVKEISQNAKEKPFIVVAVGLPYVVNIKENGDTATIVIVHDSRVTGDMQRDGQRWKIVALQDDALMQRIVAEVVKHVDLSIIPKVDVPEIHGQIKKRLPLQLPIELPEIRIP
jgi:ABC-type lipoprotein release transport system permease subunit